MENSVVVYKRQPFTFNWNLHFTNDWILKLRSFLRRCKNACNHEFVTEATPQQAHPCIQWFPTWNSNIKLKDNNGCTNVDPSTEHAIINHSWITTLTAAVKRPRVRSVYWIIHTSSQSILIYMIVHRQNLYELLSKDSLRRNEMYYFLIYEINVHKLRSLILNTY